MDKNGKKLLIVHDLEDPALLGNLPEGTDVIDANKIGRPCIGCFGCWVKTPATCIILDGFENIGRRMAACDRLVLVSRCTYGGFSPQVKNVLDRCIAYILPFFTIREDDQMHHQSRYEKQLELMAHFYGDVTEGEKKTATKLLERNALNLNAREYSVRFHDQSDRIGRDIA